MKILHTSDWHLGKRLENHSRIDEQREVLLEICEIVEAHKVQVVVVAGDIFDTFVPPAEAEELFFDIISRLADRKRIVIIVSGNHDDSVRLNASHFLSANSDVYFAGCKVDEFRTEFVESGVRMCDAGKDYFIVEDYNNRLFIATLPYPTELRLKEKIEDSENYEVKVKRWINRCFEGNTGSFSSMLVTHLFMLGGEKTDGERSIELGGARMINKSVIPNECLYTALGHLHKRQVVDKKRNIIYSGSILQYSFDEAGIQKSVTVFDIEKACVRNLEVVNLTKGKQLFRISAKSISKANDMLSGIDGYVEVTLDLDRPLDKLEHKEFCKKFPNASLRLKYSGTQSYSVDRRELSDKELFIDFYKNRFGIPPEEELVNEFLKEINKIEVGDETC